MLQIQDVSYRFSDKEILNRVSLSISLGWRVGLIGRNGVGKTTLLKLIQKVESVQEGKIVVPKGWHIGTVSQYPPSGEISILQFVLDADVERKKLLFELEQDDCNYGELYERLKQIDGFSAEGRASMLLLGLGFKKEELTRSCDYFSGGWRMRVALAAALFAKPQLLLLDEPSNHLDIEASMWLESYLKKYEGAIILVSHERSFLNSVCTHIAHINFNDIKLYAGNYENFERVSLEQSVLEEKSFKKNMERVKHMQKFVDRFRAKNSKAKQAQSRLKMINKINMAAPKIDASSPSISFLKPKLLAPPLINMANVSVSYSDEPNKIVLDNISLRIDPQEIIGILGQNGNGKSTFLKAIAHQLQVVKGKIVLNPKLNIGYFSQHQTEELDSQLSLYEQVDKATDYKLVRQQIMSHLGRVGLASSKASDKISTLSGGEKVRLSFSLMSKDAPELLLLDEPTNHLDIDMRKSLLLALAEFEGATLIVSHDFELLNSICDRLLLVAEGKVSEFKGDLDDYKEYILKSKQEGKKLVVKETNLLNNKNNNISNKEKRQLQKEALKLERKIEKLNKELEDVENMIAKTTNPEEITTLGYKFDKLGKIIDQEENNYLIMLEKISD